MQEKTIKRDYIHIIQPCFAFVLLPMINLYGLFLANPLLENISYISNALDHAFYGLLWASSCSCYLLVYTKRWMKKLQDQNRLHTTFLYLSCLGMLLSVVIPYEPEQYPFLADFHIQLSMISTLLYVLVFFLILYVSFYKEHTIVLKVVPIFITIVGSCGFLFLLMGNVSTLVEVIFVISMGIFLLYCENLTT